jgi:hypothetical protein
LTGPEDSRDELEASEAYRHGRTQHRLLTARAALLQIATGEARNMTEARAIAKLALDMTTEEV